MNKESSGLCPGLFFTSFYLKTVQKIYVFFIVVDTKELGNQTDIVNESIQKHWTFLGVWFSDMHKQPNDGILSIFTPPARMLGEQLHGGNILW